MVNFPGRNDRRRRVLKEEVLSASSSRTTGRRESRTHAADGAQRYSDAAGVENHAQVTDFVPRRYGTVAMLVFVGVATTALMAAMHLFVVPFASSRGMQSAALDLGSRGNLASWLAAVVLFLASGFCILTYSIRRHRIDDYRGRFRIWIAAALACLILSANSIAGIHLVLADVLTHVSGWTAMRGGAVWWLGLAGLPLVWIFVRVLLDIRECRVGAALLVGAAICYAMSAASFLGYVPGIEPRVEPLAVGVPLVLGHWFMLAAIVANARFVVLDAQGLITRRKPQMKRAPAGSSAKQTSGKNVTVTTTASASPNRAVDAANRADGQDSRAREPLGGRQPS
jgi:hypothetical protein